MPPPSPFPLNARSLPFDPMFGWLRFTLNFAGMLQASGVVIATRLGRMAVAGPNPVARDRREFTRMVQEKPQAAFESMQAMMMRMMVLNLQQSTRLAQQMVNASVSSGAWMAPAAFFSAQVPARMMQQWMNAGMRQTQWMSRAGASVAGSGLRPVHSRAAANARRLSR